MTAAHRWPNSGKSKWQSAYECASGVYESLRNAPVHEPEDRMALDFAAIVLNAIISIEQDKKVNYNCFERVSKYLSPESKTPLLKVGYSLNILLEKLMADRIVAPASAFRLQQSQPSTSNGFAQRVPKEEKYEEDNPGTMEVKYEEEIKQEPIYEGVELLAPKEEPLVDVFCPGTGDSRPLESPPSDYQDDRPSNYQDEYREILRAPVPQQQCRRSEPMTSSSSGTVRGGTCFICNRLPVKFYSTPPNAVMRNAFLNRVIKNMREDLDSLFYLKKSTDIAYFCSEHVNDRPAAPEFVKPMKKPRQDSKICELCGQKTGFPYLISPEEEELARVFFSNLVELTDHQLKLVDHFIESKKTIIICRKHYKNTKSRTTELLLPVKRKIEPETSRIVPQSGYTARQIMKTPLPSMPQNPSTSNHHSQPAVPQKRLLVLLPRDQAIIGLRPQANSAAGPSNAIQSQMPPSEPPQQPKITAAKRFPSQSRGRYCDLCGKKTPNYMISPKGCAEKAALFFSNVVGLTPVQLARCDEFKDGKKSANVCRSHYEMPEFENDQAKRQKIAGEPHPSETEWNDPSSSYVSRDSAWHDSYDFDADETDFKSEPWSP